MDIKIKETEYIKKNNNIGSKSLLNIELYGNDINHVIVNTIRRLIIQHVPVYAFDNVEITKNTSVYNNDTLKLRLKNFPVHSIKNDTVNFYMDIINNTLDEDKLEKITLHLDKKNLDSDNLNITTDDAKHYSKDKLIPSIYQNPLLITKLKEKEELKLTMSTDLNIGFNHIKYSPVSICIFEILNDNKYLLKLESNGQLDEYEILKRSLQIAIIKLNNIIEQLKNKDIPKTDEGELIFENEDHTLGNLLSYYLQTHNNILYSSYKLEHLLIKNVYINYKTDGVKSILEILFSIIKDIINIFNLILKQIK